MNHIYSNNDSSLVSFLRNKNLIVCTLSMTMLMIVASLSAFSLNAPGIDGDQLLKAGISAYFPHSPIMISGDMGFFEPPHISGVISGIGTEEDPFIIAGWEIEAFGLGEGILVMNTNAYFRIDNNKIIGATGAGIHLSNVNNGAISNNIVSGNTNGIVCDLMSSDISMDGNVISDSADTGIRMLQVDNTRLENNTVDNAATGLELRDSPFCRLKNFTAVNITVIGQTLSGNFAFEQTDRSGKGPRTSGDANISQCDKLIIKRSSFCGAGAFGLRLSDCSDALIEFVNTSDCAGDGVIIDGCDAIIMNNVTGENCGNSGMRFTGCTDNGDGGFGARIENASFNANGGNGLTLKNNTKRSDIIKIKAGANGASGIEANGTKRWCFRLTATDNNSGDGMNISGCENITIENCSSSYNKGNGIRVNNSLNVTMNKLNLSLNNLSGIFWKDSEMIFITKLSISYCNGDGLNVSECENFTVKNSSSTGNKGNGMRVNQSSNGTIRDTTVSNNTGDGLNLTDCKNVRFLNSTANSNKGNGITANNTSNSTVSWSKVNLNSWHGMTIFNSDLLPSNVIVTDSSFVGGRVGLSTSSSHGTFDNLVIKENSGDGLIASDCSYLRIDGGIFSSNGGNGINLVEVKFSLVLNMSRSSDENNGSGLKLLKCTSVECTGGFSATGNSDYGMLVEESEGVQFCPGTWSFSGFQLYGNDKDGLKVVNSKNVTLANGTSSSNKGSGCNVSNSKNVTVKGCAFVNNTNNGLDLYHDNETHVDQVNASNNKGSGINVTKACNLFLSNVTCKNNSKDGVKINSTVNSAKNATEMKYVSCTLNGGNGINLFNLSAGTNLVHVQCDTNFGNGGSVTFDVTLQSLHISNSSFNFNLGDGLHFDKCGHVDVRDSDANHNANGIVAENTTRISISGGNANWNFGSGVVIKSSSNATVIKLKVNNNTAKGIDVSSSTNDRFEGVFSSDNLGYGICLSNADRVLVWNCTFTGNNGGGIQAFDGGLYNLWNSSSGYGNWWSDWTTPDLVAPWGIVDLPYDIAGSAGAKDYCPRTVLRTVHSPIYINGEVNLALKAMAEGWSGDGSPLNPYIIANYAISATSCNGIQIINTNAYIIIDNVVVTSTSHAFKGIVLNNADNVRIQGCTVTDSSHGIYITGSRNLNITGCNVSSNSGNGIYLISSANVVLNDCDAHANGNHGMHLSSCQNVDVSACAVTSNAWNGMYARLCTDLVVYGSDADSNGMYGMYLSGCTDSTVMGGGAGSGADSNVRSGIGLAVCNGITVDQIASTDNGGYGVRYDTSGGVTITDCILTGNTYGPTYP